MKKTASSILILLIAHLFCNATDVELHKAILLFPSNTGYYEMTVEIPDSKLSNECFDNSGTFLGFTLQDGKAVASISAALSDDAISKEIHLNAVKAFANISREHEIQDISEKRIHGCTAIVKNPIPSGLFKYKAFASLCIDNKFILRIVLASQNENIKLQMNNIFSSLEKSKINAVNVFPTDMSSKIISNSSGHELINRSVLNERVDQLTKASDDKIFLDGISDIEAKIWKQLADREIPAAQLLYGVCLLEGSHYPKDTTLGAMWIKRAAEQNLADAQSWLGGLYRNGIGFKQNYDDAFTWVGKGASQDSRAALFYMGIFYEKGIGVKQNYETAYRLYYKAAHLDFALAQCRLGYYYFEGIGIDKNKGEALKWFASASNQGNSLAQYYLGLIFHTSEDGTASYRNAFELWAKSSIQGNVQSEFNLGHCYEYGLGTCQDFKEAAKWYKKAGDQGDPDAKKRLMRLKDITTSKH